MFVIERAGSIVNVSESVLRIASMGQDSIHGKHFREFLLELNPEWSQILPGAVIGFLDSRIFLPWHDLNASGMGWMVHALRVGEDRGAFITISCIPGLAPEMSSRVSEGALSESVVETLHNMFMHAQQSEIRFRKFLKVLPGISFLQQSDLSFSRVNTELKFLLGEAAFNQLEHQSWTDWIHPESLQLFYDAISQCQTIRHPVSSKLRLVLPDQKTLYLMDIRYPVVGLSGRISSYEVLWIDLTRQRTAEKRLHEAAWKDSLAEVSASLTHDFNNLIGGIVNLSRMVQESLVSCPMQALSDIKLITDGATKAQHLVQQVVSLNKNKTGCIELFDIRSFLEHEYDILRIVLPQRIRFDLALPDESMLVRMDKVALSRTIVNFATNARDAIGKKGKVTLQLNLVSLKDYPRDHIFTSMTSCEGRAAEIVFSDDGSGISEADINQIFSPYFTTKGDQKGTGMGLASLYRYAEDNCFDFGVRSTLGKGAQMYLLLPLDDGEAPAKNVERPKHSHEPYRPDPNEELNVAIYAHDMKYARFMESNLEQDFEIRSHVLEKQREAVEWFRSGRLKQSVFIAIFEDFEAVPPLLLEELKLSFGLTCRIFISSLFQNGAGPVSENTKQYFDVVLRSTQHPFTDNQLVLRALGHSSLFTQRNFPE